MSARDLLDPLRPWAFFNEAERSAEGAIVQVSTVFLTNRECPWKCVMCDLWKNTLTEPVARGAIPAQIDYALARLEPAEEIKLYNSGSFFDVGAIPPGDYGAITALVQGFERVIVESHPALIGDAAMRFRDDLRCQLEVAMGLETADPLVLAKLNKGMTLDLFRSAADRLDREEVAMRAFVLVNPPFAQDDEALEWAKRSTDFAFDCKATAVSLIPLRGGNKRARMDTLEAALDYGMALGQGRVFADIWELPVSGTCPNCHEARVERLARMNLAQQIEPAVLCPCTT